MGSSYTDLVQPKRDYWEWEEVVAAVAAAAAWKEVNFLEHVEDSLEDVADVAVVSADEDVLFQVRQFHVAVGVEWARLEDPVAVVVAQALASWHWYQALVP